MSAPGAPRGDAFVADPTAYWDDVARSGQASVALWRVHADCATTALLERWLPARCGRVLKTDLYDESCTEGLVPALAARGASVVGIDVSTVIAAAGRRRAGVDAVAGDVRRLPFRSESFDVVVSNSTLDHFASHDQIERALRELERVLVPDGVLILTLDNARHPLVRLRNALAPSLQRLGIVPYAVGATHGPRGLYDALAASGFAVVELTAVHHFPRLLLVAAERLLRGRGSRVALRAACLAETLERWPTRSWTGQYVAALARPRPRVAAVPEVAA